MSLCDSVTNYVCLLFLRNVTDNNQAIIVKRKEFTFLNYVF